MWSHSILLGEDVNLVLTLCVLSSGRLVAAWWYTGTETLLSVGLTCSVLCVQKPGLYCAPLLYASCLAAFLSLVNVLGTEDSFQGNQWLIQWDGWEQVSDHNSAVTASTPARRAACLPAGLPRAPVQGTCCRRVPPKHEVSAGTGLLVGGRG